jgi:hypothetical protein
MQKLSEVFAKLHKDRDLIKITRSYDFSPDIKNSLRDLGWFQKSVVKAMAPTYWNMGSICTYECEIYKKGDKSQGCMEWYNDLAKIVLPEHTPGILTRILG